MSNRQPASQQKSTPYLDWMDAAAKLRARGEAFVLITVLEVKGSAPRDSGTKMLVTEAQTVDTIGGGHLEYSAIATARQLLTSACNQQKIEDFPLGAKLGQCCGGSVKILFESFAALATPLTLFGAGHVGRALVTILAPLPFRITWVDSRDDEFPDTLPAGVKKEVLIAPEDAVQDLSAGSFVVVMTHQHPLDYAITEAVLKRNDCSYLGVIGSITKARRFAMRLAHRGFNEIQIARMVCPIGSPDVPGKHPMEVAVSIAAQLIALQHSLRNATQTSSAHTPKLLNRLPLDPLLPKELRHD